MKNSEKPINPYIYKDVVQTDTTNLDNRLIGLTKREYFAAMAMQGILVNAGRNGFDFSDKEKINQKAIELADELLNQLEK